MSNWQNKLDLDQELNNFNYKGFNLSLDEKMQLEMALHNLHANLNHDELVFWGKIMGIKNDYYIALGITYQNQFEFPLKRFYWCLSGDYNFKEMPDLNDQHKEFIDRDSSYFTGEPQRKLKQPVEGEEGEAKPEAEEENPDEAKAVDSDQSEPEEIKVPPKELVELDRLNYVVLAIENDCACAPVGAFKMTAQHQVRRNLAFRGLSLEQSLDVANYLYFRNVQNPIKKKNLDKLSAPFDPQFLDSLSEDVQPGNWSFQLDANKKKVIIQSMQWTGFLFFHTLNSNKFGQVYIGDGTKST